MNACWYVVAEIYTTWETLTQNFDANSMRRNSEQTNEQTYEQKDKNYLLLSINARGYENKKPRKK